jgi:hypothetical protein
MIWTFICGKFYVLRKIGERKQQQQSKSIYIINCNSNMYYQFKHYKLIESSENGDYNCIISYWQCLRTINIRNRKTFFCNPHCAGSRGRGLNCKFSAYKDQDTESNARTLLTNQRALFKYPLSAHFIQTETKSSSVLLIWA